MNVSELMKMLETFPPDLKVVTAGEAGGIKEVESMYETRICDNHASQPSYFFGLVRRDPNSLEPYRLSQGNDRSEAGVEPALLLE